MSLFETFIIAIVEGLTEFLPVSSTGHMIITQALLGVESTEFVKAFTVNIQLGAILSVVVLYRQRFLKVSRVDKTQYSHLQGIKKRWSIVGNKYDFYVKLLTAFIPAAVIGFLAGKYIDSLLESVTTVAVMLVVGGIVMLFVDRWFNRQSDDQSISHKRAWKIGLFQCIAMIPGVSRSMATIVGGMATKLSRKNAAEFSFFLAVPTMLAASAYKLLKDYKVLFSAENLTTLLIGNMVAFVIAMLAIKFFINFLTKYGFKAFGWYRIVVGTVLLALIFSGVDLAVL
jgi:undecaprenyl-diphosphatase